MNVIKFNVGILKTVLSGFAKVIGRKTTLPILSHIKVDRSDTGNIRLQVTDLDVWASYRLEEVQPSEPVTFLVPFELLNRIVKALKPDASISLIQDSPKVSRLVYETGSNAVDCKIEYLDPTEWPQEPSVTGPVSALPPEFKQGLKEALECASTDSSRAILNGACVDVDPKKGHYLVGTNGCHLYAGNSYRFNFKEPVLLRAHKLIVWSGLADDGDWELSASATKDTAWFKLTTKHWDYVGRQMCGAYPNWRQVVPEPNSKWTKITFPEPAVEMLLRSVPLLPGADVYNCPVTLEAGAGGLKIKGRGKDDTEFTTIDVPDAQVFGKPATTNVNREYLLKALRFGLLSLVIEDELSAMVFNQGGKTMVVMPVRPSAVTPTAAKPETTAETTTPPVTAVPSAEERKPEMNTMTPPERGNLKPTTKPAEPQTTTSLIDQVEQVKESLKNVIRDLTTLADGVKLAEKEKRASEKEVETARGVLKKLQSVSL